MNARVMVEAGYRSSLPEFIFVFKQFRSDKFPGGFAFNSEVLPNRYDTTVHRFGKCEQVLVYHSLCNHDLNSSSAALARVLVRARMNAFTLAVGTFICRHIG